jgi:hypothetical protein
VALATGWAPDVIEDLPAHRYRLLVTLLEERAAASKRGR